MTMSAKRGHVTLGGQEQGGDDSGLTERGAP